MVVLLFEETVVINLEKKTKIIEIANEVFFRNYLVKSMVSVLSLMEIIMFKKIVEIYRVIMDLRYNPLRYIPDPILQGYLLMALFVMWCLFFGLIAIYHLGWLGYSIPLSIAIHLSLIVPAIITNAVFLAAENGENSGKIEG